MATTKRTRTITRVAAGSAGLGLAAISILGFSNAAFSAKADPNTQNNWSTAGSVDLDLNAAQDAPLFSFGLSGVTKPEDNGAARTQWDNYLTDTPANLNDDPADTDGVRDVTVNYVGEVDATIKMYATQVDDTTAVDAIAGAANIKVTVDGNATPIYTGPLSGLGNSYATSAAAFNVDSEASDKSPDFNVTLTQGTTAAAKNIEGVRFHWEAQQSS
jgi:hypothetical protein